MDWLSLFFLCSISLLSSPVLLLSFWWSHTTLSTEIYRRLSIMYLLKQTKKPLTNDNNESILKMTRRRKKQKHTHTQLVWATTIRSQIIKRNRFKHKMIKTHQICKCFHISILGTRTQRMLFTERERKREKKKKTHQATHDTHSHQHHKNVYLFDVITVISAHAFGFRRLAWKSLARMNQWCIKVIVIVIMNMHTYVNVVLADTRRSYILSK